MILFAISSMKSLRAEVTYFSSMTVHKVRDICSNRMNRMAALMISFSF